MVQHQAPVSVATEKWKSLKNAMQDRRLNSEMMHAATPFVSWNLECCAGSNTLMTYLTTYLMTYLITHLMH